MICNASPANVNMDSRTFVSKAGVESSRKVVRQFAAESIGRLEKGRRRVGLWKIERIAKSWKRTGNLSRRCAATGTNGNWIAPRRKLDVRCFCCNKANFYDKSIDMNKELNAIAMPNGSLTLEWTDAAEPGDERSKLLQERIYSRYRTPGEDWLFLLAFGDRNVPLSSSLSFFRNFASEFVKRLTRTPDLESIREKVRVEADEDFFSDCLEKVPMTTGAEYLTRDVLAGLWGRLNETFRKTIAGFDGTVEEFVEQAGAGFHLVGKVYFHLVESKSDEAPFAFLATYSTRVGKKGRAKHVSLKNGLEDYGRDGKKLLELLTPVHRAAEKSELVRGLLESGELFHPLAMTAAEAFTFLKEVPLYENAGVMCGIPNWWKGAASGAFVKISLGDAAPSAVGMNALLEFKAELYLGDEPITAEEARRLLEGAEGLALIKGKWVAADPEKLEKVLNAYEKAQDLASQEGLSVRDALRFQLNPEKFLGAADEDGDIRVAHGQWMESTMKKLADPAKIPPVRTGSGFKATLRPYQKKGVDWLWFLHNLGFGACLADDMGLGKTVQLLAFMSALKSEPDSRSPKKASLLIVPASLISNWEKEIARFFPDMKYAVAHPGASKNGATPLDKKVLDGLDMVVTTYALAKKYDWLQAYSWRYVVLDEAQAIKNAGTKQSKAVRKLDCENRVAMTGTPIENRLSDLWSLFDFLNPGLLGGPSEFKKFASGLKDDPGGYARLRRTVSPYVLRRLKTDRNVISDLPEKVEMKTFTDLSRKQVALYRKLVSDLEEAISDSEGIQRRGLVLASLVKFKQICNHPDQYLGGGGYEESGSGKFSRLREISETILEKREKVLIFTQFKEMTEPLAEFLSEIFGREGLVLHGSVPVGKRKKLIERFQSDDYVPFMVLSLKAGGVGLNLTAANHVIHFDRWWNPAVENQATDRAFRIGQKKNVVVHKFVTKGTVEEKIDLMLEKKAELSGKIVVATGENWITELENDELMELFKLSVH